MTGQLDIEVVCMLVAERLKALDNPDPLLILPIYSQLPADMQVRLPIEHPPVFCLRGRGCELLFLKTTTNDTCQKFHPLHERFLMKCF